MGQPGSSASCVRMRRHFYVPPRPPFFSFVAAVYPWGTRPQRTSSTRLQTVALSMLMQHRKPLVCTCSCFDDEMLPLSCRLFLPLHCNVCEYSLVLCWFMH